MEETQPRKLVGRKGRRRDQDSGPVVTVWKTDVVDNKDPDFEYQFFQEHEVREKLKTSRIAITDHETGQTSVHNIRPWTLVHRDAGPEEAAGFRPDEGKPIDTYLRHGPYLCMKLPREDWLLLQRAQEQRADAYEERLQGGRTEEYDMDGNQARMRRGQKPAITIREQPLQRT